MRKLPIAAATLTFALLAASCSSSSGVASIEANRSADTVPADTTPAGSQPPGSSPSGTAPTGTEQTGNGNLDWGACDRQVPGVELECAKLTVPLDYNDPTGATIDLALARVQATGGRSDRIGSLVFNPGGPGGSGIEFLGSAAPLVPSDVADRFDLVSFDPRGVGASTAVKCDIKIDDNIPLLRAGDDAGWNALVAEATAQPATCDSTTAEIGSYVGTNNAARDLDRIRAALGDDKLSYVGFSYGTRLGATYAELFPDNVRALVLDGGVKPTDDSAELDREQGPGFDKALENFAAACDADTDCVLAPLGPTLDTYKALLAEIQSAGSFKTDDPNRKLTPGELELGVAAALYSKDSWPFLAEGLYAAKTKQDGTLLQVLGDSLVGRQPDGTYSNEEVANTYISCADEPRRPDTAQVRAQSDQAAAESVWFGDFLRASTGCIGTPNPIDPLQIGPADGAPPILVIGNSDDPATPYAWSVALADSLSSAVLYTAQAEGHTAFLSVDCVAPVVVSYLVDLTMPAAGSSCSDNATADFFPPAGTSQVELVVALFDCLRANGADVPELTTADVLSDPTGEKIYGQLDPSDPKFVAAATKCQDIIGQLGGD